MPSSTLTTMGFRGEALFCLSNLSNKLMISTRTAEEDMAMKMEFHQDGSLHQSSITYIPRKIGTTVAIVKLFDSIPVRRNDMIRRMKYQRSKLLNMMEGYAIFSLGVRIHLMDMIQDKSTGHIEAKTLLSTTSNNKNLRETVSCILGSKFLMNMSNVDIDLSSLVMDRTLSKTTSNSENSNHDNQTNDRTDENCDDDNLHIETTSKTNACKKKHKYRLYGLISKAGTMHHRGIRQGQFFCINRRPVDLPKVSRLINDTWRSLSASGGQQHHHQQSHIPSFVLQFVLPNNAYDINLSPDKRQVIFTNESDIFHLVQQGMIQLWKSQTDGKFIMNNHNIVHNYHNNSLIETTTQCKKRSHINDNHNEIGEEDEDEDEDIDEEIVNNAFGIVEKEETHQTSVDNNDRKDNNLEVEVDQDEFIASRRYGFADDPTMAVTREIEDRIRRQQYLANQQQMSNSTSSSSRRRGIEDQTPEILPLIQHDGNKVGMFQNKRSVSNEIFEEMSTVNSTSQVLISPSPLQWNRNCSLSTSNDNHGTLRPENNCSNDNEGSGNHNELYASSRLEELRAAWNERKQWQEVVKKFNASSSSLDDDDEIHDPMNETIMHLNQMEQRNNDNLMINTPTSDPAAITNNKDDKFNLLHKQNDGEIPPLIINNSSTNNNNDNNKEHGTKRKMFGLERFGFRAVKRVSNVNESNEQLTPNFDFASSTPSLTNRVPCTSDVQGITNDTTILSRNDSNEGSKSNRYQRIVSLPKNSNDSDMQQKPDHEVSEFNPPLVSKSEAMKLNENNTNNATEEDNYDIKSIPATAIWKSAMSTNDVLNATIRERLAMYDRRYQFRKKSNNHNQVDLQNNTSDTDHASFQLQYQEECSTINTPGGSRSVSLSKDDFRSIKIHGQFNLGFILATTNDGNLWILDQHACDEKYNFEKLCKETIIHEQTLIAPMSLELSPIEEACVLENMEIFEMNGFRFKFDPSKPIRHRLSLTALPHSGAVDGRKAVQFGVEDVIALCEILNVSDDDTSYMGGNSSGTGVDGSGKFTNNAVKRYASQSFGGDTAVDKMIVRLPKAIAMFASRACRGSIMIGKALSDKEMKRIVNRLADVEQPWNCPHGRPTLRHLIDIKTMIENDEKVAAEHVAGPTVTIMSQDDEDS
jgi:DNA mismatch repair ATPase MutL